MSGSVSEKKPTKEDVAGLLEQIATLLEAQEANPFRIRSYRDGAQTVRATEQPLIEWAAREEMEKLEALPNIGEGLAGIIVEYVTSGRSSLLDELQGEVSPEQILRQVPGIGQILARRITSQLEIDSLEELEQAAYDGRLASVEGFGERRLQNVRASLAGMLSRSALRHRRRLAQGEPRGESRPPVRLLLAVDNEYRQRAEAGDLKRIAPKRFNPEGKAWLPIMRMTLEGWRFTALFSNTARAHELQKTHDWVVIYYEAIGEGAEGQNTVVTETSGPLTGKRVVRGREEATRRYYAGREET